VVTKPSATATKSPVAKADPADVALASQRLPVQADFPADWRPFKPGVQTYKPRPIVSVRQKSTLGCSVPAGAGVAYPWVYAYNGTIFQKGKYNRFVSPTTLVFHDEADAESYAVKLRSAKFVACVRAVRAEDVAKVPGAAPGSTFRAGPVEAGKGALRARFHFIFQALSKGKLIDYDEKEDVSVYRFGRVVTFLSYEEVAADGEPRDLSQTTEREVNKAASRLVQRAGA
jgi:hypothetical protein